MNKALSPLDDLEYFNARRYQLALDLYFMFILGIGVFIIGKAKRNSAFFFSDFPMEGKKTVSKNSSDWSYKCNAPWKTLNDA